MTDSSAIRWDRDADGVVVLTMNDPGQATNTWNAAFRTSLAAIVDRLEAQREDITGVILTSGKQTFHAGADLKELRTLIEHSTTAELVELCEGIKDSLRRLETLGRPVVAAINGSALGGGLELALATHRRIGVNDGRIRIGLPEVTLGAIPGAGGVVRTVRMLGLADAMSNVLAKGQRHRPAAALQAGIVDELVDSEAELIPAAKVWIAANPAIRQPWDRPCHRIPGGPPTTVANSMNLPALTANIRKQLKGADLPAIRNLLAAAMEGAQLNFAGAMAIETRYFVDLLRNPATKAMVQAFFALNKLNGGSARPDAFRPRKLAMIGAGMMGAGIAYEYAKAGVDVVLKDVSPEAAERGKTYSRTLVEQAVARGRWSQERADELLARIRPTADAAELAGADLMIEAVFEDPELKKATYPAIEEQLASDALLASNTSQIPITALADAVRRPDAFIGMHFSSPVEKMPFVEIVKGAQTSDDAVRRAVDAVRLISKTPIVVNDGRGFFLTRLFMSLIFEALDMLADGVPAASIEQAAAQAGFSTQPLLVIDQISLTLVRQVIEDNRAAAVAEGHDFRERPGYRVVERMIEEFDRKGRAAGAGFYDYAGERIGFWPGLREAFGGDKRGADIVELKDRMLFIVAIEVLKCRAEGIVTSDDLADIGSVFAGFPASTGGALHFVYSNHGGAQGFLARAAGLAATYGDRFDAKSLVKADALAN
ncbi:3-hydroxyacyl-CoA dehydrogenase NAD-binding domain-containing protein [Nocardia sp. NPDC004604]|uniref:3-hydroxyacyl-CoA dehydrogenase NAD-binding domain-containing protein n=1 Tax=Nocardia sp. NPDC004604 TaxID=3157013 RepID=UPI0033B9ABA5